MNAAMETHRRECEARDWLRKGYTDTKSVDQLKVVIAGKRGQQAADELREEMRRQWGRRRLWEKGDQA